MKDKIKEALQQGFKNLGLSDEVFEGVATSAETFIKNEADIDGFVGSDVAKKLLTFYQADNDRKRTKKRDEKPDKETPEPKSANEGGDNDIKELIKAMQEQTAQMKKQNEALTARIDLIEKTKTAQEAFKDAEAKFKTNEWANGYPELRDAAWAQAVRVYEKTGKNMTADELNDEAMEAFKPLAKAKGLDISKPFEGDKGAGDEVTDFSEQIALLKSQGVDL